MTERKTEFQIDNTAIGERIDIFAARALEDATRSQIQKLITAGKVLVNGTTVKPNYKLQNGDVLTILRPDPTPVEVEPEPIQLDVLYEDDDVIVINKARGMVVHPAAGNYTGTLVNALLSHCGSELSGINGEIRPGIVHRLDKDTSGVMVAAKSNRAHISLAKQIKDRTATRKYLAILHGNVKEEQGVINAPIGRHPVERKKMAVTFSHSREAITHFAVLKRFGKYTLVECRLRTGRTHQIRVHMAYIGHPVVGDPVYGPKKKGFAIEGQALHAAELRFIHPANGKELTFSAPLPADMRQILSLLEKQLGV